MKISALIKKIPKHRFTGSPDTEIAGLYYDSRQVSPGGAFFAVRGSVVDGHRFIDDALTRGAVAIFMEEERQLPDGVVAVVVDNARLALALASAEFFGDPTSTMPTVGVT